MDEHISERVYMCICVHLCTQKSSVDNSLMHPVSCINLK